MLAIKSQCCGLTLGVLLSTSVAMAQTKPSQPKPPPPPQATSSSVQADSAIDADVPVDAPVGCPSADPSNGWFAYQNQSLLEAIGDASQNSQSAMEAEVNFERQHHITSPKTILSTRLKTLRILLKQVQ
jgi:hypothetical protein